MKKIIPYQNCVEALNQLDNGGRFYNLFTKAKDGEINVAELSKVAGRFNQKQRLILFLELSLSKLSKEEQIDIISKLDDDLRKNFLKYKAQELKASEVETCGVLSSNVLITGVPTIKDTKSEFQGLILIPIFTGNVMSFVPVPIMDMYDIYEINDEDANTSFLIAHTRSKTKLPSRSVTVGGALKEIEVKVDGVKSMRKYLEVNYYI